MKITKKVFFRIFSEGLDISHGKFDDGFAFSDILKIMG